MLGERELSTALLAAQAKADCCRRWCRIGSSTDGVTSEVFHNGIGNSDTDHQRIYDSKRLALPEDGLASVLADWILRLHTQHQRIDLNAEGSG